MVWNFLGGSSRIIECAWEEKGNRARQRAVYEQFCILFLFFPIPHFFTSPHLPLSPSSAPPPPAGCLILSRFQHAFGLLEELQVCWWNLVEKVVGLGRGSWHNKPEGNERLPLVARVRRVSWKAEGNDIWQLLGQMRNYIQGVWVWEGETAASQTHITMRLYGGREESGASWADHPSPVSGLNVRDNLSSRVHILPRTTNHPV